MKELISIYVSLFLVFSPLYGQTKQEATIYLTSGNVHKVTVIEIGEEVVEVEIYQNGLLLKQKINKSMIYQILLPGGEALYRNPDAKDIFEKAVERIRRIKIEASQKKEYEKREKWNIYLMGEVSHLNVALWDLRGDSMVISDMGISRRIYIGSIANISAIKGKTNAGKGAKIGAITGALIPITLAVIVVGACITGIDDGCGEGRDGSLELVFGIAALAAPFSGGIGTVFGAVIGSFFKSVEKYDMSGLSIDEKKAKIQEIMKK